ncbi:MAG: hypothetical protein JSU00_21930 [Acidobacteria bacterium]|nr:hypothetical protein [Acidobacteriota bacterium]
MVDSWNWRSYVSVGERRRQAAREVEARRKKGQAVSPVLIDGRTIVRTFWGKAWCENLERYSDFANRLPRGRTYVRHGSVVDLQIAAGEIHALVSGSSLYEVQVKVEAVSKARWRSICEDCAGGIDSLVELLQGRLSKAVMERICRQGVGLFPAPREIAMSCGCPDWATMCKHVAAVLYGIGARFDKHPELLFRLREVDEKDLIASAGKGLPTPAAGAPGKGKVLGGEDLADLFGLDMATGSGAAPAGRRKAVKKAAGKKTVGKKTGVTKTAAKKAAAARKTARKRAI